MRKHNSTNQSMTHILIICQWVAGLQEVVSDCDQIILEEVEQGWGIETFLRLTTENLSLWKLIFVQLFPSPKDIFPPPQEPPNYPLLTVQSTGLLLQILYTLPHRWSVSSDSVFILPFIRHETMTTVFLKVFFYMHHCITSKSPKCHILQVRSCSSWCLFHWLNI